MISGYNNPQAWGIYGSSKKREKTPFERMLEAKERATGCVFGMRGILDKLEADLRPQNAKTGHAIEDHTERDLKHLRVLFIDLCNHLGKYRDAEMLPEIVDKKKAKGRIMPKSKKPTGLFHNP